MDSVVCKKLRRAMYKRRKIHIATTCLLILTAVLILMEFFLNADLKERGTNNNTLKFPSNMHKIQLSDNATDHIKFGKHSKNETRPKKGKHVVVKPMNELEENLIKEEFKIQKANQMKDSMTHIPAVQRQDDKRHPVDKKRANDKRHPGDDKVRKAYGKDSLKAIEDKLHDRAVHGPYKQNHVGQGGKLSPDGVHNGKVDRKAYLEHMEETVVGKRPVVPKVKDKAEVAKPKLKEILGKNSMANEKLKKVGVKQLDRHRRTPK